jgi:hypothetical protein
MKINTDNDKIHKARKSALDLIVSNHYADCVAPCKQTCPAGVDVQGYISLIEKGMYSEAVALIKQVTRCLLYAVAFVYAHAKQLVAAIYSKRMPELELTI